REIFGAMREGMLGQLEVEWARGASACVVAANRGYAGKYESDAEIQGLEDVKDARVQVLHAGTSRAQDGKITATGGRVLGVTAAAEDLASALDICYASLARIHWAGMQ